MHSGQNIMEKKLHLVRNTMEKGAEVSAKYITKKCNFYPLYFAKNAFFCMCFAETSTLSPLHFAQNVIFGHCILPRMHFFGMYFAETPTLFSIVGCLKCLFFSYIFPKQRFCFPAMDCRDRFYFLNVDWNIYIYIEVWTLYFNSGL